MNNDNNTEPVLYAVGARGYSAYEVAVQEGFVGTVDEWLASLVGPIGATGPQGKSAYQIAVDNGFVGTEEEWVHAFLTPDGYYTMEEIDAIVLGQLKKSDVVNDLDSSETDKPLSANQGKILNTAINTVDGKATANQTDIANEILDRQNADASLEQQIIGLGSGAPIPVSSTSDMTDTTKLYVLTGDGYVYYYDGNDWTQGWVYQAAEDSDTLDNLSQNVDDGYLSQFDLSNKTIKLTGEFNNDTKRVCFTNSVYVKKGAVIKVTGYTGLEYMRVFSEGDNTSPCTIIFSDTNYITANSEYITESNGYINVIVRKTGGSQTIATTEDLVEVKIYDSIPSRLLTPGYANKVLYNNEKIKVTDWLQGNINNDTSWAQSTIFERVCTPLMYLKKGTEIEVKGNINRQWAYAFYIINETTKEWTRPVATQWYTTDGTIIIPYDCYFYVVVSNIDATQSIQPSDVLVEVYISKNVGLSEINKYMEYGQIPKKLDNLNTFTITNWKQGRYYYVNTNSKSQQLLQYVNASQTIYLCTEEIYYVPKGTIIHVKGTGTPDSADALRYELYSAEPMDVPSLGYQNAVHITEYNITGDTYVVDKDSYIFANIKALSGVDIPYASTNIDIEITFDFTRCSKKIIKDYYQSEMTNTIDTVKSKMDEPCIVFGLVTDIHYKSGSLPNNFNNFIQNIDYANQFIPFDFIVNLGDNTDFRDTTKSANMKLINYMINQLKSLNIPICNIYGNHDDGRYSAAAQRMTMKEMFKTLLPLTKKVNFDFSSDGRSYYFDFEEMNVRFIMAAVINNYQYAYSDDTANWIINTALNTTKDVVFCSHLSTVASHNYQQTNPTNATKISNALIEHQNAGHGVIELCGHSHADYEYQTPYLTIFTCCQKYEVYNGDEPGLAGTRPEAIINTPDMRHIGDYTEDCWNVMIIRPHSRKVTLVRFGVGDDREFTY